MASFDVEAGSMDEFVSFLQAQGLFSEDMQEKLLTAGAEQLQAEIRTQANRTPYRLQRINSKLSRSRKIKKDKNGNYYMTVTVSGKNEKGERNATVAFVLNYGRSKQFGKISGSYFWTKAVNKTERTILPTYERIVNKELSERGLI